jgi:hypothetical protein
MPFQFAFCWIVKLSGWPWTSRCSLVDSHQITIEPLALLAADLSATTAGFICTHWGAKVNCIKRPSRMLLHQPGPDHNHLTKR